MYKEYDSELLTKIRAQVENRCKGRFYAIELDVDLSRVAYSRPIDRHDCNAYILEADGGAVGYTEGGFGTEGDSVYAYLLNAFPRAECNYEFISYRYNRDKVFLFSDGKLIGYLKGGFESDLEAIKSWDFYLNDWLTGTVKVNAAMRRDNQLALRFTDGRDPIFCKLEPPPLYTDLASALNYFCNTFLLFNRPPSNDFVFVEPPDFDSIPEMELIFCAFVFFRSMVFC